MGFLWFTCKMVLKMIGKNVKPTQRSYKECLELLDDDIFCTNPKILQQGIDQNIANSILVKLIPMGKVLKHCRLLNWLEKTTIIFYLVS